LAAPKATIPRRLRTNEPTLSSALPSPHPLGAPAGLEVLPFQRSAPPLRSDPAAPAVDSCSCRGAGRRAVGWCVVVGEASSAPFDEAPAARTSFASLRLEPPSDSASPAAVRRPLVGPSGAWAHDTGVHVGLGRV